MYQRHIIAVGMIALAASVSRAEQPVHPPKFELAVSPPFGTSGRVERYRAGEVTLSSPPYRFVTTAAVTKQYGDFGPRTRSQSDSHGWSVKVYATFSKKIAAAYDSKKDCYQLGMTRGAELEIPDDGSYMIARLRRKRFSWGNAVTFLSQFSQDLLLASPSNGRLDYQIWGVTADRKYTVVASIWVSHPKLPNEENHRETLRDYRTIQALRRDPDYKLIEKCEPEEFTPSLMAFDQMLDSLTFR
jgi:hypothetical protein